MSPRLTPALTTYVSFYRVQELSLEYPDTKFVGVDIAPSAMHYPQDNLQIEVYNFVRDGFSCPDGYYDVVHARHTISQVGTAYFTCFSRLSGDRGNMG